MKVEDSKALKEYQEKLKRARCTGNLIDPDESLTVRMNRIQRAKNDVKYLVETYLPHYATADCADFQIAHANKVMNDPIYKGAFLQKRQGLLNPIPDISCIHCTRKLIFRNNTMPVAFIVSSPLKRVKACFYR